MEIIYLESTGGHSGYNDINWPESEPRLWSLKYSRELLGTSCSGVHSGVMLATRWCTHHGWRKRTDLRGCFPFHPIFFDDSSTLIHAREKGNKWKTIAMVIWHCDRCTNYSKHITLQYLATLYNTLDKIMKTFHDIWKELKKSNYFTSKT